MAHGNIYKPDKVDAALSNYFRPGNLTALRELALLWVADRVDEYLQEYRGEHGIRSTWQARERIVVGLTGGPEGRTLIRRAARLAEKGAGGEVLAVYIARSDGLSSASPKELAVQRTLVEDLGGTFHHVIGDDVPHALLEFARGVNATQIVLGVSRRKPWQYVFGRGVSATVAVESGPDIDVHMVTHDAAAKGRRLPLARGARLGRSRIIWGWATGVAGPALLTLLLSQVLPELGLANDMLLFLTFTVAAALLGGLLPALASAAFSSLLLNYFFTPPLYRLTISDPPQHRRHLDLRRGGRVRGLRRRPGRPPHPPGRPAARRVRDPLLPRGQRPARRELPRRAPRTPPRDLHHAVRRPPGAGR
ncbi:hypothetical protein GCM10020254_14860 [Streptomyces goshikiensis]